MSPVISIIIPVYNVEKYLRRCLDSCVNQTFKDIEIIVVNDASPDNCDVIMREYKEKYPDIIRCIYLTENIKQGGARNRGLEIAAGQYIMFVDSDDWLDICACEKLYKSAQKTKAELVICDCFDVSLDRYNYNYSTEYKCDVINAIIVGDDSTGIVVPWGKIIRKELIVESQVFFPENTFYEDLQVVPVWCLLAKSINIVSAPLYYYVVRSDSTSRNVNNIEDRSNAIIGLITNLINNKLLGDHTNVWCLLGNLIFIQLYWFIFYFEKLEWYQNELFKEKLTRLVPDIQQMIMYSSLDKYKKRVILNYLTIENYIQKVTELDYCKRKIIIWGAGKYGMNVFDFFNKRGGNIECFIDNNRIIQKNVIRGKHVYDKEFIRSISNDIKIVVALKSIEDYYIIEKEVKKINSEVNIAYFTELFELKNP